MNDDVSIFVYGLPTHEYGKFVPDLLERIRHMDEHPFTDYEPSLTTDAIRREMERKERDEAQKKFVDMSKTDEDADKLIETTLDELSATDVAAASVTSWKVVRPEVPRAVLDVTLQELASELDRRLNEKGPGGWKSRHELLGVVTEEWDEVLMAVRSERQQRLKSELMDLAVACVFGAACIDHGTLDW